MRFLIASIAVALCGCLFGCTMTEQSAPELIGPSEFATSIVVSAAPDLLPTDGRSQALVTIQASDAQAAALRNLSLRIDTRVGGTIVDFGTLSARSVVTDASGRARLVYTAPLIVTDTDTGAIVDIGVTPAGTNFANAVTRTVSIRLVPPGVVVPPDGGQP